MASLICVSCLWAGKEAQEAYNHPTCAVKTMFSPWLALSRHARDANTCSLEYGIENILMGFRKWAVFWLGQAFSSTHSCGTKVRSKRLLRKVLTGRRMAVCDSVACDVVLVVLLSVCCSGGRWKCVRTGIVFPDIWPETESRRDWWGVQHTKFGTRLHLARLLTCLFMNRPVNAGWHCQSYRSHLCPYFILDIWENHSSVGYTL